jgi:hypothetical protein
MTNPPALTAAQLQTQITAMVAQLAAMVPAAPPAVVTAATLVPSQAVLHLVPGQKATITVVAYAADGVTVVP